MCRSVKTLTKKFGNKVILLILILRACLHGGGGPQVGEVACLGEVKK